MAIVHCSIPDLELLNSIIFSIYLQISSFLSSVYAAAFLLLMFHLLLIHILRKTFFVNFKRISFKNREVNQPVGKYLWCYHFSIPIHPFEAPHSALAEIMVTSIQSRVFISEGWLISI